MANPSSANVAVGKPKATGGVYAGATSATLPTNATASLDSGLTGLGYVSEDGLTQTEGRDTTQVRAWGGDVVKVVQTSHDLTYTFNLIEAQRLVFQEVYGSANVSWTDNYGGQKVTLTGDALSERAYVFEMLDGDTAIRIVVPKGQITDVGDVQFVDGQVVGFPITVTCLADSSGNKAYWYFTQFAS